jgi:hypothetical protein
MSLSVQSSSSRAEENVTHPLGRIGAWSSACRFRWTIASAESAADRADESRNMLIASSLFRCHARRAGFADRGQMPVIRAAAAAEHQH